eukprot:352856-Chlamydomonas_euryale.AAC.1
MHSCSTSARVVRHAGNVDKVAHGTPIKMLIYVPGAMFGYAVLLCFINPVVLVDGGGGGVLYAP